MQIFNGHGLSPPLQRHESNQPHPRLWNLGHIRRSICHPRQSSQGCTTKYKTIKSYLFKMIILLKNKYKKTIIPVAASLPLLSCTFHVDTSHWTCRGYHRPRLGCRSWWSTVAYRLLCTTAGCRYRCLTCLGSGWTPLQRFADTVGPGCTWCLVVPMAGEWWSLGHPGGSLLTIENTALDYIQGDIDDQLCVAVATVNVSLSSCDMMQLVQSSGQTMPWNELEP